MPTGKIGTLQAKHADNSNLFYIDHNDEKYTTNIDKLSNNLVPLFYKIETAINAKVADLSEKDPGQISQSDLMGTQVNISGWQLICQLISNVFSSVGSALKSTAQNIGR